MQKLILTLTCLIFSATLGFAQKAKVVTAESPKDLLQSISANTLIKLKAPRYQLSGFNSLVKTQYVSIEKDAGTTLIRVKGVDNLTLEGIADRASKLLSNEQQGPVMIFENCNNLTLTNLEAGHGPAPGTAKGSILVFINCRNLRLNAVNLFGSGTMGLEMSGVQNGTFIEVNIQGCSQGIMQMQNCRELLFQKCRFTNNKQFDLIRLLDSEGIVMEDCLIDLNRTGQGLSSDPYALIHAPAPPGAEQVLITLRRCAIEDNLCQYFTRSGKAVKLLDCQLNNNIFEKGFDSY